MKKTGLIVLLVLSAYFLQGCLVVEKMVFDVRLMSDTTGYAVVTAFNVSSDAVGNKEFDDDVALLADMNGGDGFLDYMREFGREVLERHLYIEDGKLNGSCKFTFKSVKNVESIQYDGEYYYLRVNNENTRLGETNGTVIEKDGFKWVVWEKGARSLKFEFYNTSKAKTRDLVPAFKGILK